MCLNRDTRGPCVTWDLARAALGSECFYSIPALLLCLILPFQNVLE